MLKHLLWVLVTALICAPVPAFADGSYTQAGAPCIALTFDDGPSKKFTSLVLDSLRSAEAHATFYLVGKQAIKSHDLVRLEFASGEEIGNHSWRHAHGSRLTFDRERAQYTRDDTTLEDILGTTEPVTTLRAPYGEVRRSIIAAFSPRPFIFWTLDTLDWKYRDSERLVHIVVTKSKPGDIVLMHDIHPTTVAAVPGILAGLKARGFTFVTVSELRKLCTYFAPIH